MDFTAGMYRRLCVTLRDSGYVSVLMGEYPKSVSANGGPRVILRHDVDRVPSSAIVIAEMEREMGLNATYFFRCVGSAYQPSVIAHVRDLDMEVGYHYECLDRARGDYEKAYAIAREDLAMLRQIASVKTMAMHGNPLTPYDNRDLWKKYDFHELGIEVAAYTSLDYSKLPYYTDTGRNWDESKGNLYDKVGAEFGIRLKSTPALIAHLQANPHDCCISTHPHRWTNNPALWLYNAVYDHTGNTVKAVIKMFHHDNQT